MDADMEEDDDVLAQDLADLEELSVHLNLQSDDDAQSGRDADRRPLTGGTSASASTTARGGSSGCEAFSADLEESTAGDHRGDEDDASSSLRGAMRAQYELQHCSLPQGCRVECSPASPGQWFVTFDVNEGPYMPCSLTFWVKIFDEFPHGDSYSIRCTSRIFHPNVEPETGRLNLERQVSLEATCRMRTRALIDGIRRLIAAPTDSPAVNAEAAMLLQTDPDEFRRVVRLTLAGGEYGGIRFDRVLPAAGQAGKAKTPPVQSKAQRALSDKMLLDIMELEVIKEDYKDKATAMLVRNTKEIEELELA